MIPFKLEIKSERNTLSPKERSWLRTTLKQHALPVLEKYSGISEFNRRKIRHDLKGVTEALRKSYKTTFPNFKSLQTIIAIETVVFQVSFDYSNWEV